MKNFDESIGTRVRAIRLEKATAAAREIPNSLNRRPTLPSMNDMGTKHRHQDYGGRDHGEADFATAVDGGQQRRLALFHAPDDVLEYDDRVVHHQADRQHQAEQRQRVDRITEGSP